MSGMTTNDQMVFLFDAFEVFWSFGVNFDMLLQSDTAIIQYRQFLEMVNDRYENAIRINIEDNLMQLGMFYSEFDFKGSDCKKTGVITGALMRKMFGF